MASCEGPGPSYIFLYVALGETCLDTAGLAIEFTSPVEPYWTYQYSSAHHVCTQRAGCSDEFTDSPGVSAYPLSCKETLLDTHSVSHVGGLPFFKSHNV